MDLGFAQVDSFALPMQSGVKSAYLQVFQNQIPEHDKEIVAGALSSNTTLITGDSQLVVACRRVRRQFFTPLQVSTDGFAAKRFAHIFRRKTDLGCRRNFARESVQLPPHEDRRRTIIFAPGLVWIYVTSDLKKWVCEFAGED